MSQSPPSLALSCFVLLASLLLTCSLDVSVNTGLDRRGISPSIYGINFASQEQITQGNIKAIRWGGNTKSRYNYQIDVENTASDYFFENVPGCWNDAGNWCSPPPTDPKEQSSANQFITNALKNDLTVFFTIPALGWISKAPPVYGHPLPCSYPRSLMQSANYDEYDTECGDGKDYDGNYLTPPAPTTTSVAITSAWTQGWVTYLKQKFGSSQGRIIYQIDNEPSLWSDTHHDVHPSPSTYDEIWDKTRTHAEAILAADPTAEISMFHEWGWTNYFCSALDMVGTWDCSASSPDRAAHGGLALTPWLLKQAQNYANTHGGKRLIHYLDLHYYAQGGSNPQRTRSLYDKSYQDPSWIADYVYLIPRMREWVDAYYPGTKLIMGEYDFYEHTEASGTVAQAEALGIFGREGLHVALQWEAPAPTELSFAAYRIFRNYNGARAAFGDTSVRVSIAGTTTVRAFAAVDKKSSATELTKLTIVLVNESPTASVSNVILKVQNFTSSSSTAARYTNNPSGTAQATITRLTDVSVTSSSSSIQLAPITLSAMSVYLVEVSGFDLASGVIVPPVFVSSSTGMNVASSSSSSSTGSTLISSTGSKLASSSSSSTGPTKPSSSSSSSSSTGTIKFSSSSSSSTGGRAPSSSSSSSSSSTGTSKLSSSSSSTAASLASSTGTSQPTSSSSSSSSTGTMPILDSSSTGGTPSSPSSSSTGATLLSSTASQEGDILPLVSSSSTATSQSSSSSTGAFITIGSQGVSSGLTMGQMLAVIVAPILISIVVVAYYFYRRSKYPPSAAGIYRPAEVMSPPPTPTDETASQQERVIDTMSPSPSPDVQPMTPPAQLNVVPTTAHASSLPPSSVAIHIHNVTLPPRPARPIRHAHPAAIATRSTKAPVAGMPPLHPSSRAPPSVASLLSSTSSSAVSFSSSSLSSSSSSSSSSSVSSAASSSSSSSSSISPKSPEKHLVTSLTRPLSTSPTLESMKPLPVLPPKPVARTSAHAVAQTVSAPRIPSPFSGAQASVSSTNRPHIPPRTTTTPAQTRTLTPPISSSRSTLARAPSPTLPAFAHAHAHATLTRTPHV